MNASEKPQLDTNLHLIGAADLKEVICGYLCINKSFCSPCCLSYADGSGMDSSSTPTSPPPSSGNGIITQPKKIRGVGFGDIFSEGSVKLKVRLPSSEIEDKKEKVSAERTLFVCYMLSVKHQDIFFCLYIDEI